MSAAARICVTCRFFNPYGTYNEHQERPNGTHRTVEKLRGQCRAHSPSIDPNELAAYTYNCAWPIVPGDDWCGEWASRNGGGV